MKKQILDALTTKFPGVSDNILGRVAENLAKTVKTEDDVTTAVEGVTFQQVLDSYGDARATQAAETSIRRYEQKHGLKDGQPTKKAEEQPKLLGGEGNGDGTADGGAGEPKPTEASNDVKALTEQVKALLQAQQSLTDEIKMMKGEKASASRRERFMEAVKDAPEKLRARYEKDFERLNKTFETDEDFSGWLEETTSDINELSADFKSRSAIINAPKAGGGGDGGKKAVNPMVQARINEQKAAVVAPAIQGLQTKV